MSSEKLLISIKEIKKILKYNYNIIGSIKRLDGEIDYNFKVESSDKKEYLLKISRSNFNLDYIDYQIKLLDHLEKDFSIKSGWVNFLADCVHKWIKMTMNKEIEKFDMIDSWVVRQFKNEYNPIHWHAGHVSGAGFLKIPKDFGKHVQNKNQNMIF